MDLIMEYICKHGSHGAVDSWNTEGLLKIYTKSKFLLLIS